MSSSSRSSEHERKFLAFLADFRRPETRQRFENLAVLSKTRCEAILAKMGIKGMVLCRVKKAESLEKKLHDMAQDPEFTQWASTERDIYKHPDMADLAGVRIGLYLPGDVVKVAAEIPNQSDMKHLFGTVTGGRDTTHGQERNLDIQRQMNGPWRSQDLKGADEHWQHYGYKSWQMVVEWNDAPTHNLLHGLKSLRVEIQIGTVVSQAWAEVQHNIIYKNPADILATPTMKRMIDAVNGLAITTEIILEELERSGEVATKEAEANKKRVLYTGTELISWLQATFMSQMSSVDRQRWVQRQNIDTASQITRYLRNVEHDKPYPNQVSVLQGLIEQEFPLQFGRTRVLELDEVLARLRRRLRTRLTSIDKTG
jgi:ppGpp synthetase/RelA/SpoT-type nucleotidyltranferase